MTVNIVVGVVVASSKMVGIVVMVIVPVMVVMEGVAWLQPCCVS